MPPKSYFTRWIRIGCSRTFWYINEFQFTITPKKEKKNKKIMWFSNAKNMLLVWIKSFCNNAFHSYPFKVKRVNKISSNSQIPIKAMKKKTVMLSCSPEVNFDNRNCEGGIRLSVEMEEHLILFSRRLIWGLISSNISINLGIKHMLFQPFLQIDENNHKKNWMERKVDQQISMMLVFTGMNVT